MKINLFRFESGEFFRNGNHLTHYTPGYVAVCKQALHEMFGVPLDARQLTLVINTSRSSKRDVEVGPVILGDATQRLRYELFRDAPLFVRVEGVSANTTYEEEFRRWRLTKQ